MLSTFVVRMYLTLLIRFVTYLSDKIFNVCRTWLSPQVCEGMCASSHRESERPLIRTCVNALMPGNRVNLQNSVQMNIVRDLQ